MRRAVRWSAIAMASLGSVVFQSCPINFAQGLFSDCFGEDTISQRAYDALNVFEQLLYEENDCDRYEPRSSTLNDLF